MGDKCAMLKIGLLGLNYLSTNFGCSALAYSFLELLNQALEENDTCAEIVFIFNGKNIVTDMPIKEYTRMTYRVYCYNSKTVPALLTEIKKCDLYFDFTAGDSFSDIYGMKRFFKKTFVKSCVEYMGKTFVLGPQTYGPFKNPIAKLWAKDVFRKSAGIYTRDSMSFERAKALTNNQITLVTDVAFALPYDAEMCPANISSDKIDIGINFSGLLYEGGYSRNNQFGLTVNYKEYAEALMEYLTSKGQFRIHLIPHVISSVSGNPDNDLIPTEYFKEKYPKIEVAPKFKNPMEAKSYICQMDIFSGARMHATIGAFSSGVCCIPFSYSPKFEGLYGDLGYHRCIGGRTLSTDEAVSLSIEYINNADKLRVEQKTALQVADSRLSNFKKDLSAYLKKYTNLY